MLKKTKAQLIIVRYEIVSALASDSKIDISNLLVVMDKKNVPVKQNNINKDDHKFNQECKEIAHETST